MCAKLAFLGLFSFFIFKLAIYLPFEFSINSNLVDTVAAGSNLNQQHAIEILGRTLSSFAVLVLVLRFLIPLKLSHRIRHLRLWASLVVLCGTFFGFKAAVNVVASQSTPEFRYDAVLLSVIPQTIRIRTATVQDLPCNQLDTAAGRTCLAMSGAMLFYDPITLASIQRSADSIVQNLAISQVVPVGYDAVWREYRTAGDKIRNDVYPRFVAAGNQYLNAAAQAKFLWGYVNQLRALQSNFLDAISDNSVANLRAKLLRYFSGSNRWSAQARAAYEQETARFGRRVSPEVWCDGLGCPGAQDFISHRLRELLVSDAIEKTHINPDDLGSGPEGVAAFVQKNIPSGISLPDNWWLNDGSTFESTVQASFIAQARSALVSIQDQLNASAPLTPTLCNETSDVCFRAFESSAPVQDSIIKTLQRDLGYRPTTPVSVQWDWNKLKASVIDPAVAQAADKIREEYLGSIESYGDGGKNAARGRASIKIILIATISLSLSLLFGLWNIASVVGLAVRLPFSRPALKQDPKAKLVRRSTDVISALALLPILGLPFLGQNGLAAFPGYRYARDVAVESAPFNARVVEWVVRVEPSVLPWSDRIRHLVLGDEPCIISPRKYDFFLKLDQLVIGRLPGYDDSEKSLEHVDRTWKVPPRGACVL